MSRNSVPSLFKIREHRRIHQTDGNQAQFRQYDPAWNRHEVVLLFSLLCDRHIHDDQRIVVLNLNT